MPWKNAHEMNSPSQMMNPNRHTTYTMASLPMPSSMSLRKLETMPMEKKVSRKKMVRKALMVPETLLPAVAESPPCRQRKSRIRKVNR